jgi:hypothetical protein
MKINFSAIVLVVLLALTGNFAQEDPIYDPDARVEIPDLGAIQGLSWWTSTTLRKFHVFHGIPYAKDTAMEKRFKVLVSIIVVHFLITVFLIAIRIAHWSIDRGRDRL